MKKAGLIYLMFLMLLTACAGKKQIISSSATADGSSYEKAVVITETSESTGIKAEYAWLSKTYPGYTTKSQSLNYHDKKPYDIINIETSSGEQKAVYFEISNFFGKI